MAIEIKEFVGAGNIRALKNTREIDEDCKKKGKKPATKSHKAASKKGASKK